MPAMPAMSPTRRTAIACTACRTRKIRCVPSPTDPARCNRCTQLGIACVVKLAEGGAVERRLKEVQHVIKLEGCCCRCHEVSEPPPMLSEHSSEEAACEEQEHESTTPQYTPPQAQYSPTNTHYSPEQSQHSSVPYTPGPVYEPASQLSPGPVRRRPQPLELDYSPIPMSSHQQPHPSPLYPPVYTGPSMPPTGTFSHGNYDYGMAPTQQNQLQPVGEIYSSWDGLNSTHGCHAPVLNSHQTGLTDPSQASWPPSPPNSLPPSPTEVAMRISQRPSLGHRAMSVVDTGYPSLRPPFTFSRRATYHPEGGAGLQMMCHNEMAPFDRAAYDIVASGHGVGFPASF
ncbi:hypothetical protein SAICODRAFT_18450 [Saitoella complicata NRRL Y-17804]|nr:uncharacterized protein SAICODRAFT_18450 [Saitoella complicata NRRL Y-17804]ODQ53884.1 hypothetical protein SAICODRAFT_18450 [Saitoella complicata NRRL Y-17804]